ncbi:MAG: hypothetical protein ACR2GG_01990 [Gemmatimonadaceae bacterium]
MSAAAPDVLAAGPERVARPGRRGRWLMVVAVLAAAAVALLPVVRRGAVDRSGLRRLQAVWVQRDGWHTALFTGTQALDAAAAPQDLLLAEQAVGALQRQDAARLHRLARQASGVRAYGSVRRLRSDLVAALTAEASALEAAAAAGRSIDAVRLEVTGRAQRVAADLRALQARLHVPPPAAAVRVRLTAADPVLHRLSRLLDRPLPLRLLVSGPDAPAVLDLASSRVQARPAIPNVPDGLIRGGYLITADYPLIQATPLEGGPPRTIASHATAYAPGPRADQVWIAEPPGLVLSDVTGRVLHRVAVAGDLQGATTAGVILSGRPLAVWDPIRRRTVRRLGGCSLLLAADADRVVVGFCPADTGPVQLLHVVDVATGRDRIVGLPAGEFHLRSASLAPDGQHLAFIAVPSNGDGRLFLADVNTATVTAVSPPAQFAVMAWQVWTADSHRLFFTAAAVSGSASPASLWTYALGDHAPTAIRYLPPGPVAPLAVLPPR